MEKAAAIGNSRTLFRLIRNTGTKKPSVSEIVNEEDGSLIHSQERRLARWAEHFEGQFNFPSATAELPNVSPQEALSVETCPPNLKEEERKIVYLKRHKAA